MLMRYVLTAEIIVGFFFFLCMYVCMYVYNGKIIHIFISKMFKDSVLPKLEYEPKKSLDIVI